MTSRVFFETLKLRQAYRIDDALAPIPVGTEADTTP